MKIFILVIIRAIFSETWPQEVLNTLSLTEKKGWTIMLLRAIPINASPEEHKSFEEGYEPVLQGF